MYDATQVYAVSMSVTAKSRGEYVLRTIPISAAAPRRRRTSGGNRGPEHATDVGTRSEDRRMAVTLREATRDKQRGMMGTEDGYETVDGGETLEGDEGGAAACTLPSW